MSLLCLRCGTPIEPRSTACACGWAAEVGEDELRPWFDESRRVLETAYLARETPWQQSGKGGTIEDWTVLRRPVADCVETPGSFLDIGCANGFLLECLVAWTREKGVEVDPYGLDHSPALLDLARQRLPRWSDRFYLGNSWDWEPPRTFDYVRTELCYVPRNHWRAYAARLLDRYVSSGGALLVAHYRGRSEDLPRGWTDNDLRRWGFAVEGCRSGYRADGSEGTRVAVVRKA